MVDKNLVICRTCKHTAWLEDYELVGFIQEHGEHKVLIFPSRDFEHLGSIQTAVRDLMGWRVEASG